MYPRDTIFVVADLVPPDHKTLDETRRPSIWQFRTRSDWSARAE